MCLSILLHGFLMGWLCVFNQLNSITRLSIDVYGTFFASNLCGIFNSKYFEKRIDNDIVGVLLSSL